MSQPDAAFLSKGYQLINRARLQHLDSLVRVAARPGSSVLEVAAGIGDLTPFWIERGFEVSATEGRAENIAPYAHRHPGVPITQHDLEGDEPLPGDGYDIVHAYGILYHLSAPARGVAKLAAACRDVLFLETCVSYGDAAAINMVEEPASNPTQALGGVGCRPTRPWLLKALKAHFPHVYVPHTQPAHDQFPLDWTERAPGYRGLTRSVFVASRRPIDDPLLSEDLLMKQTAFA